jgi:hypothetical protein
MEHEPIHLIMTQYRKESSIQLLTHIKENSVAI